MAYEFTARSRILLPAALAAAMATACGGGGGVGGGAPSSPLPPPPSPPPPPPPPPSPPPPTLAPLLANALLKLADLSPVVRNTNVVGDSRQDKAGPQGIAYDGINWRMYFEAVQNTDLSGFATDQTGPMLAKATTPQGPWTITRPSLLVTPNPSPNWENNEVSPSSAIWEADNNRWVVWFHGGNNLGPRQIGVMYSTDQALGENFGRDGGNPILTPGAAGASDDKSVSDLKIQRLADGSYFGFYCGRRNGGPSNGTIHRVTGATPASLTKRGETIAQGPPGAWNENGHYPGLWWKSPDGRLHMFAAAADTGNGAIGYFYSDDNGASWTAYAGNPIASGTGGGRNNDTSMGDVGQGARDGDVLFMTTGVDALSFPINPPMRGQLMLITPARVSQPSRSGKFYVPGPARAYTTVTGTSPLSSSAFTVIGRFRAYRLDRAINRKLYTEFGASNLRIYAQIEGAGASPGKLGVLFQTPSGSLTLLSTADADDGRWHEWMFRRTGASAFDLWVDGVQQTSAAPNVSVSSVATSKAIGNWHPSSGGADEPSRCTISDHVNVLGLALSWTEAKAVLDNRIFPGGASATVNFPTDGVDSGDVALVEASG